MFRHFWLIYHTLYFYLLTLFAYLFFKNFLLAVVFTDKFPRFCDAVLQSFYIFLSFYFLSFWFNFFFFCFFFFAFYESNKIKKLQNHKKTKPKCDDADEGEEYKRRNCIRLCAEKNFIRVTRSPKIRIGKPFFPLFFDLENLFSFFFPSSPNPISITLRLPFPSFLVAGSFLAPQSFELGNW